MIDQATEQRIRQLLQDIHSRDEMVEIYGVAQQIRTRNGTHELTELTDAIAKEAMRIHAAICWHQDGYRSLNDLYAVEKQAS